MKLTAFLLTILLAGDSTPFVFPNSKRYLLLKEKAENNEVLARERGCPEGEVYCEVPLSYPSSKIARALEKVDSSFMRSLLNTTVDTEELDLARDIAVRDFILSRTLPEPEFERVCTTKREFIQPRQAKSKSGDYRFIVNGGEGLEESVQRVSIIKCLGAGQRCEVDSEHVTECRQEHAEHRLVALDEKGEQLVMETFMFPSGCSCYKKNVLY